MILTDMLPCMFDMLNIMSSFLFISSLQHLADSRLETIAENEELKSNISKLQETKKELTSKISHLDKEKLNYENQCSDLELKVVINFLICFR